MTKSATRALGLLLIVSAIFSLSGCDFGSKRISDIEQYGQFESYIELPEFFPDTVDGYTVNAYAYHLESWMDTCYEILLDITVAESQFEELLSGVLAQGKECYYSEGFYEVVFEDHYDIFTEEEDSQQVVGYADIEKIISLLYQLRSNIERLDKRQLRIWRQLRDLLNGKTEEVTVDDDLSDN